MIERKYLTTGEFAKLCHTSKHTLFHYCDIGLFNPVYTDKNGYRYYHVLQYDTFLTIRQLHFMGMPLVQIKQYLETRSPEKMITLFQEQECLIQRQISQLQQIQNRLHTQRINMQQAKLYPHGEFFISDCPDSNIICTTKICNTNDYDMTQKVGNLIFSVDNEEQGVLLGMICDSTEALQQEQYSCRFYIHINNTVGKNCEKIPSGKYLSTYHHGTYETLQETYKKLYRQAEEQGYILSNQIYTETVIGDWAVESSESYVMKVSIQIKSP